MTGITLRNAEDSHVRRRIFRAVRQARGLTLSEAADRLGVPDRTYRYFESGRAGLDLRRIDRFADAMETDASTILVSLLLDDARFAVRCLDNGFIDSLLQFSQSMGAKLGPHLARLDVRSVAEALQQAEEILGRVGRAEAVRRGAQTPEG